MLTIRGLAPLTWNVKSKATSTTVQMCVKSITLFVLCTNMVQEALVIGWKQPCWRFRFRFRSIFILPLGLRLRMQGIFSWWCRFVEYNRFFFSSVLQCDFQTLPRQQSTEKFIRITFDYCITDTDSYPTQGRSQHRERALLWMIVPSFFESEKLSINFSKTFPSLKKSGLWKKRKRTLSVIVRSSKLVAFPTSKTVSTTTTSFAWRRKRKSWSGPWTSSVFQILIAPGLEFLHLAL